MTPPSIPKQVPQRTVNMTDYSPLIISELDILRRVSATEPAGTFKVRAYATAIKTIKSLGPIYSVANIPPPAKGDGLGAEIRKKLTKIIEHGSLDIPAAVRAKASALDIFLGIYGVGPKKAEDLIASGYTSLAEIRAASEKDAKLLNKNQKIGLQYYEDLQTRIPRAEMDRHSATLMANKPDALEGVIVGSYRRGKPDSGDIDMLVRTSGPGVDAAAALSDYVKILKDGGYIEEVLAHGEHKCMAICKLPAAAAAAGGAGAASSASAAASTTGGVSRRLDLLITPPAEFPFAVFYFTGSDTFNVAVRAHALTRGFTLNEHGIVQVSTGRSVSGVKTEKDIFSLLKLVWREPKDRTDPEAVSIVA